MAGITNSKINRICDGGIEMSLSRKYRRAMERKLLKDRDPMTEIKRASSEVYERLHDRTVDKDTHDLVSAMYYLIGLALKQEYGFGATRVLRVYKNIDNQLEKWQTGELKSTDFRKMAMDELGIDLQIQ